LDGSDREEILAQMVELLAARGSGPLAPVLRGEG